MQKVFECKQCGHCCEGQGGIVLSVYDIERICNFLEMDEILFQEKYIYLSNGKQKIKTGENGFCIFFETGKGCAIHSAKPDICRAWPFFRGNLACEISLEMAKDFCPGIIKSCAFKEFAEAGLKYLETGGLSCNFSGSNANALKIDF